MGDNRATWAGNPPLQAERHCSYRALRAVDTISDNLFPQRCIESVISEIFYNLGEYSTYASPSDPRKSLW